MGKLELTIETEKVRIYSPVFDGVCNEFNKFLLNNRTQTHPQLQLSYNSIIASIKKITQCGARENLFRPEGGRVKAVPLVICFPFPVKKKVGKMRLYCLRLNDETLIIGNGGVTIEGKYDDDPIHQRYVDDLRKIDKLIKKELRKNKSDYSDNDTLIKIIESITF